MQYRTLGKTGKEVSILGFGTMRLPTSTNRQQDVIEKESVELIRRAIESGVNYFDTAYPYHGGRSEGVLGKALSSGYRDKVYIADKFPVWLLRQKSNFQRLFTEQLKRLKTDRIDFYLMHALNSRYWDKVKETGIMEELEKAKDEGLIGHIGFSFHDEADVFKKIIDEYPQWEFCQIQYNYIDVENQAGTWGLEYAASKNLGIVIMEPLRGGQLTAEPPEAIRNIWDTVSDGRSLADRALRFIWDIDTVSVILSGMNSRNQLEENLRLASSVKVNQLTPKDKSVYADVRRKYQELQPIPCTACNYCMPCPSGVHIPEILRLYNERVMYNSSEESQRAYNYVMQSKNRADKCVECGQCEDQCPQGIEIISWLKKAHKELIFS